VLKTLIIDKISVSCPFKKVGADDSRKKQLQTPPLPLAGEGRVRGYRLAKLRAFLYIII